MVQFGVKLDDDWSTLIKTHIHIQSLRNIEDIVFSQTKKRRAAGENSYVFCNDKLSLKDNDSVLTTMLPSGRTKRNASQMLAVP